MAAERAEPACALPGFGDRESLAVFHGNERRGARLAVYGHGPAGHGHGKRDQDNGVPDQRGVEQIVAQPAVQMLGQSDGGHDGDDEDAERGCGRQGEREEHTGQDRAAIDERLPGGMMPKSQTDRLDGQPDRHGDQQVTHHARPVEKDHGCGARHQRQRDGQHDAARGQDRHCLLPRSAIRRSRSSAR